MKLRLLSLYDTVTDSFWFLPALMAVFAGIAALGTIAVDHSLDSGWIRGIGWVWSGGPEGARAVLSVIAGSVMTVISIVFSLTLTALAQTSSHFGPRVLRNFTSDRGVQFTLGTFISTFVYCLLVLRTVRTVEESSFVPYLSVNIGLLLSLAALAVLIFFIHHISQSIQAENLIAEVGEDFQRLVPTLFPKPIGQPLDEPHAKEIDSPVPTDSQWKIAFIVQSPATGYLHRVDEAQLLHLATRHDLILKLEKRPGDFVVSESPLVQVWPPSGMSDAVARHLCACFSLGRHRTPHQDALYPLQQLVEIACHALSPGINEPFTALTCIDWLGASLRSVAKRDIPTALRQDEVGHLRVIAAPLDFEEIAHAVFDQIRVYGANNAYVMLGLLRIIAETLPDLQRDQDRETLIHHARLIGADAAQIINQDDRRRVEQQLNETLRVLAHRDGE